MDKVLMTIILNCGLHQCMWEIDCKTLDKIHIYDFIVCIVICWQTMSLQRKKNINVNRTDFLKTLNMF